MQSLTNEQTLEQFFEPLYMFSMNDNDHIHLNMSNGHQNQDNDKEDIDWGPETHVSSPGNASYDDGHPLNKGCFFYCYFLLLFISFENDNDNIYNDDNSPPHWGVFLIN